MNEILASPDGRFAVVESEVWMVEQLEAIQRACPVVGSFPERDPTTAQGKKLDEVLDQHKIPHDIKVYPGAAHSFFNAGRNFNPEAADDAWKRMLGFFSEHLQAR